MNAQKERKSFIEDLPPVDIVGKLIAGLSVVCFQVLLLLLVLIVEDTSSYYCNSYHDIFIDIEDKLQGGM